MSKPDFTIKMYKLLDQNELKNIPGIMALTIPSIKILTIISENQ